MGSVSGKERYSNLVSVNSQKPNQFYPTKAYRDGSNTFNETDNYFGEVQLNSREGEEGVFYIYSMGNAVTYAFYANESYHMSMLESLPHEQTRWSPEYIDKAGFSLKAPCQLQVSYFRLES